MASKRITKELQDLGKDPPAKSVETFQGHPARLRHRRESANAAAEGLLRSPRETGHAQG